MVAPTPVSIRIPQGGATWGLVYEALLTERNQPVLIWVGDLDEKRAERWLQFWRRRIARCRSQAWLGYQSPDAGFWLATRWIDHVRFDPYGRPHPYGLEGCRATVFLKSPFSTSFSVMFPMCRATQESLVRFMTEAPRGRCVLEVWR